MVTYGKRKDPFAFKKGFMGLFNSIQYKYLSTTMGLKSLEPAKVLA